MQDRPLLISGLLDYAEGYHGDARIVSRNADGSMHESNWRTIAARARRLAAALRTLGVGPGDRVVIASAEKRSFLALHGLPGRDGAVGSDTAAPVGGGHSTLLLDVRGDADCII